MDLVSVCGEGVAVKPRGHSFRLRFGESRDPELLCGGKHDSESGVFSRALSGVTNVESVLSSSVKSREADSVVNIHATAKKMRIITLVGMVSQSRFQRNNTR